MITSTILLFLVATGCALLGRKAWKLGKAPGCRPVFFLSIAIAIWCSGYALEIAAAQLPEKILFAKFQYLGISVVSVCLASFAAQLFGKIRSFRSGLLWLLMIIPITTIALVWTNEFHHFVWTDVRISPGELPVLELHHGPAFWMINLYSHIVILASSIAVFRRFWKHSPLGRVHLAAFAIALSGPWIGNIIYVTGHGPIPALDLTPLGFGATVGALLYAIRRYHLLDILPVARDAVLEAMDDGVLVVDSRRRIVDTNPAAAALLGLSVSEIFGRPIDQPVGKWSGEYQQDTGSNLMRIGERHVYVRERPLPSDPSTRILLLQDITDLLRAQEQLQQALHDSRKYAEDAHTAAREKAEFLANTSHEIRTPLNGVLGMAAVLLETELTSEQHEIAETIRTSGEGLLALVNDILDFSKIDSGRLELEHSPFDLRQCIEDALDVVASAAFEKSLELFYTISSDAPPLVIGDVTRVRQVLLNLLGNSVKFTERGEIWVNASACPTSSDVYEFSLEIHDTGIGISDEHQSRLFRPFSQVESANTRRYGGTGLGLVISRNLAELMGGTIGVQSHPGEGSVFRFTFQGTCPAGEKQQDLPQMIDTVLVAKEGRYRASLETCLLKCCSRVVAVSEVGEAPGTKEDSLWIIDGDFVKPEQLQVLNDQHKVIVLVRTPVHAAFPKRKGVVLLQKPVRLRRLKRALRELNGDEVVTEASAKSDSIIPAMRILVVDDVTSNQKVAKLMLHLLGQRADVASSGAEALKMLMQRDYNLVYLDVQMPEMDGYAVVKRIRELLPANSQPRIVAMTASALSGDREKCLASGMDDYITKPIDLENLRHTLMNAGFESREENRPAEVVPEKPTSVDPARIATLKKLSDRTGQDVLGQLVQSYLKDTPGRIQELRRAASSGDSEKVRFMAHTLKGSSSNLGLQTVAQLAQELEYCAAPEYQKFLALLESEYQVAHVSLQTVIGR